MEVIGEDEETGRHVILLKKEFYDWFVDQEENGSITIHEPEKREKINSGNQYSKWKTANRILSLKNTRYIPLLMILMLPVMIFTTYTSSKNNNVVKKIGQESRHQIMMLVEKLHKLENRLDNMNYELNNLDKDPVIAMDKWLRETGKDPEAERDLLKLENPSHNRFDKSVNFPEDRDENKK